MKSKSSLFRPVRILCLVVLFVGAWIYFSRNATNESIRSAPKSGDDFNPERVDAKFQEAEQDETAKRMQVKAVRDLIARKFANMNSRFVPQFVLEIIPRASLDSKRSDSEESNDEEEEEEMNAPNESSNDVYEKQRSERGQANEPSSSMYDVFEIETVNSQTVFRGSSGVALASAFHWWLKHLCACQITWHDEQIALPDVLPNGTLFAFVLPSASSSSSSSSSLIPVYSVFLLTL
jgi:hypothetical protein